MRILNAFIIAFLVGSRMAWGGEILSLDQALEMASQTNLSLKSAQSELGILEGQVSQARAFPNPSIEGEIAEIKKGTTHTDDATKELGISQTFEIWGKRGYRKTASQAEFDAAKARYRLLELEVLRNVKEAYWNKSFSHDRVKFAKENLQFQQRFLSRVQDRFQSGQVQSADIARAKLEGARASNKLLIAQRDLKSSTAELNRILGNNISQPGPEVEHLSESTIPLNKEKLIAFALETRPELEALAFLGVGAEAELSLAKRQLWTPDLEAGYFYQRGEREDGSDSWGGRLGLTLPLWNQYSGERKSALSKMATVDREKENLKQSIAYEVQDAFFNVQLAEEQIELFKQAVDQATESARLAQQRYLEGDTDLLVFTQARRDLVDSVQEYLETMRNYQVHLAKLEKVVGKDLSGGQSK